MKAGQTREYGRRSTKFSTGNVSRKNNGVDQQGAFGFIPELTIENIVKKLVLGFTRLFVAIKYQFYKNTTNETTASIASGKSKWSFPWFQIGLVGIIIFLFTQKDIQFSFDMRAPELEEGLSKSQYDNSGEQKMNIAQAISFRENSRGAIKSAKLDQEAVSAYIRRFASVARMEMKKFGLPASVKMAWAILESQPGQTNTGNSENNHFGKMMNDEPFTTSWENWRAHTIILKNNYPELFDNGQSVRSWIKALNKASISGQKRLGDKLLQIIETFELHQLDEDVL